MNRIRGLYQEEETQAVSPLFFRLKQANADELELVLCNTEGRSQWHIAALRLNDDSEWTLRRSGCLPTNLGIATNDEDRIELSDD